MSNNQQNSITKKTKLYVHVVNYSRYETSDWIQQTYTCTCRPI